MLTLSSSTLLLIPIIIRFTLSAQYCHHSCRNCIGTQPNQCLQCTSAYWFHLEPNQNYGYCKPCTNNCVSCMSSNRCQTCSPGFYLSQATGLCISCETGVALCTLSAVQQCKDGYQQINGECVKCPSNCAQCENQICVQCEGGYYLSNSICFQCELDGCLKCPNPLQYPNTCYQCDFGYTGQFCEEECQNNCAVCFGGICYACSDNFQLTNNKCIFLPILCKSGSVSDCDSCVSEIGEMGINSECVPKHSIENTNTQIYLTSINNEQQFSLKILNQSIASQQASIIQCGTLDFISQISDSLSFNFESPPIYGFKFKVQLLIGQDIDGIVYSVHTVSKQDDQVQSIIDGSEILISRNSILSSRPCLEYNAYILTFQSDIVQAISHSTPPFNSSSSSIIITLANISSNNTNSSILGVSEILITLYHCVINNCQLCTLAFTCDSCYFPYVLQNNQCKSACSSGYYQTPQYRQCTLQCPKYFYPIFQDFLCQSCIDPCSQCLNESYCLSCGQKWFLYEGQCLLTCPSGFYPSQETHICQRCLYPCFQCQNGDDCQSCTIGYLDRQEKNCRYGCNFGKFLSFDSLACETCVYPCLSCSSETFCTTCQQGLYLQQIEGICSTLCPLGTFKHQNGICQQCQYPCSECELLENLCTSCAVGYLFEAQCLEVCPETYYGSNSSTCEPCIYPCRSCINEIVCISCESSNESLYWLDNECLFECPPQTYADPQTEKCQACIQPCKQCMNKTFCLSCIQEIVFIYHEGNCFLECPFSTYITTQRQCAPCSQGCLMCVGDGKSGTICQQCFNNYFLVSGQCLSQCPSSMYPRYIQIYSENMTNITYQECYPCEFSCLECTSLKVCQICVSGYYLTKQNSCSLSCGQGTFPVDENEVMYCEYCHPSCQICISLSECTSCNYGYFLYQDQCLNECPSQYYPVTYDRKCQPCQFPCQKCSSLTTCETCYFDQSQNTSFYLYQHHCLKQCPDGFLQVKETGVCQKCSSNCLTCEDNFDKCISCSYLYYLLNDTCLSECPQGYFPHQNMVCFQCQSPCLTCVNFVDECLSCQNELFVRNGACLEQCPFGQYGAIILENDAVQRKCQQCQYPCKSCSILPSNCTSCFGLGMYLSEGLDLNNECVQKCPEGSYGNSLLRQCASCLPYCATCRQQNVCLSCTQNKYLINNQCLQECPLGFYQHFYMTNICSPCEFPCETCLDATSCTSCSYEYFYFEFTCIQTCPSTYYPVISGNSKQCNQCPDSCLECYDYSTCKSCHLDSFRPYLEGRNCVIQCSDGYYLQTSNNTCLSCSQNCLSCQSYKICKKCIGSFLWEGQCLLECPTLFYGDISGECLECHEPCSECYDNSNCKNCLQGYYLYLQFCLQNCPAHTWAYPHLRQCRSVCDLFKMEVNKTCLRSCPYYYNSKNECVEKCNEGEFVNETLGCQNCEDDICSLVPFYRTEFINSGKTLFLAMIFSQPLDKFEQFSVDDSSYEVRSLQYLNEETRWILQSQYEGMNKPAQIIVKNSQLLFLQISINDHLAITHYLNSLLKLSFNNYPLQNRLYQLTTHQIHTAQIATPQYFQYLGYVISSFFIVLLFINLFLDNTKVMFPIFEILQSISLLMYLDVWFHPSLQYLYSGLRLISFYGVGLQVPGVEEMREVWECSGKYIFHENGCNAIGNLLQISIFLCLFIVVGCAGKLFLRKYRKNKHQICFNHINNIYWVFGFSIFYQTTQINQIARIVGLTLMIIISLVLLYQAVKNIFKNTYAENTFFWQLKKSKCKNPLGNAYYIMTMCRRMVITFSIAFDPSKSIFPLSFATISSILIIVNIVWNKPYKKYEILFPSLEVTYCIYLLLVQLVMMNSKGSSKQVWEALSILCFIVNFVIVLLAAYICMKQTISIISINVAKYKGFMSEQKIEGAISENSSQMSSKMNEKVSEQTQKIEEETKINGIDTRVQNTKKEQAKEMSSQSSEISSIFSNKERTENIPKYLYKVQKENEKYDEKKM